jgi:FkbM family methyltransferase
MGSFAPPDAYVTPATSTIAPCTAHVARSFHPHRACKAIVVRVGIGVAEDKVARLFGMLHQLLSRSRAGVWAARKVRNQCEAIIRASFNDGIDPAKNGEIALMNAVAPSSKCFIDVGANVGAWAKAFLERMRSEGVGIAVEPSEQARARLCGALAPMAPRVHIIAAAAGDTEGSIDFYSEPNAGETSSVVPGFSNAKSERIQVELTTVDRLAERFGVGHIDFMKIDAEGYDLHVIRGASGLLRRQAVDVVQFEYNAPWALAGSTLGACIALLSGWGYEVFLLKGDGLHRFRYAKHGEYFGYSNFAAVAPAAHSRVSALIRECA